MTSGDVAEVISCIDKVEDLNGGTLCLFAVRENGSIAAYNYRSIRSSTDDMSEDQVRSLVVGICNSCCFIPIMKNITPGGIADYGTVFGLEYDSSEKFLDGIRHHKVMIDMLKKEPLLKELGLHNGVVYARLNMCYTVLCNAEGIAQDPEVFEGYVGVVGACVDYRNAKVGIIKRLVRTILDNEAESDIRLNKDMGLDLVMLPSYFEFKNFWDRNSGRVNSLIRDFNSDALSEIKGLFSDNVEFCECEARAHRSSLGEDKTASADPVSSVNIDLSGNVDSFEQKHGKGFSSRG